MTCNSKSLLDLTRSEATTLSVILPDKGDDVEMTFEKPSRTSNMEVYPTEGSEGSALTDRTDNVALLAATSAEVPDSQAATEQVVLLTASQRKALQDYCRIEMLSQE